MSKEEELKIVQSFIFDDKVQDILSGINNNLMDFNILEITGMGKQEIKYSNILGWLFDDREHSLEYQILDNFLKKIIEENRKDDINTKVLDALQSYIYLAEKKRDITIYREKDNIDLLIVDESNKVVITIENKVDTNERIVLKDCDDEDLGQLECYEKRINKQYDEEYKKYFIFLTIDLEEPSRENWMKASHQMVTDVIKKILQVKQDISTKTRIILESYIDLLKRNRIVPDTDLEELCEKIWNIKEHKEALKVLYANRPNKYIKLKKILNKLQKNNEIYENKERVNNGAYSFYIKVNKNSSFVYKLWYSTGQRIIKCRIAIARSTQNIDLYRDKIKKSDFTKASDGQFEYYNLTPDINDWQCEEDDIAESKIKEFIQKFKNADEKLNIN